MPRETNDLSSGSDAKILVAIPTFRRPGQLARLLDGLTAQVREADAAILVGDNDCDDAVRAIVEDNAGRCAVRYVAVPDRGVAQVRNALVAAATEWAPGWRWLAMLDDDGLATPGWLATIVACGEAQVADLVGGPVDGMLPAGAGLLARNSIFAQRRRWPTGEVPMLNTTQNLAIARAAIDRVGLPLFDRRYGASGGEDYDLFRRVRGASGRLAWCDEAMVHEPAPPERLTHRALLHRYATTGIYIGRIDADHDGRRRTFASATKGLAFGAGGAVVNVVRGRRDRAARSLLSVVYHAGYLASLFGADTARYAAPEPVR